MSTRILFLASSIADSLRIDAITADTREAVLSDGSVTRPSYGWVGFPDGIGFAQEVDVVSGGAIDHVIRQKASRKQLTLQFAWKGSDAYAQYQLFCAWFGRYLNLDDYRIRLSYLVGDAYERRYVEAAVTDIELEELTTGSATATVSFQPLTPWYEGMSQQWIVYDSSLEEESKHYDYSYPYDYQGMAYSGQNVVSNGYIADIPLRIVIAAPSSGTLSGPSVTIAPADGSTSQYGSVRFPDTFSISAGETLTIDAMANRIYKTAADGTVTDVFDSVDKSGQSFLYARPGENVVYCQNLSSATDATCGIHYMRCVI